MSAAGPGQTASAVEAVRSLARVSRMLERSSSELNLAHYRVLSAISAGDERASRIAARLVIGKPAVSAAVESLCRRGLLVRSQVQGDQRAAALTLSAAGETLLAQVEEEMVRRLEDLCAHAPDRAKLLDALSWLGPALDASRAQRASGCESAKP